MRSVGRPERRPWCRAPACGSSFARFQLTSGFGALVAGDVADHRLALFVGLVAGLALPCLSRRGGIRIGVVVEVVLRFRPARRSGGGTALIVGTRRRLE